MKLHEIEIGVPVIHGNNSGGVFYVSGVEGIVTSLRKSVSYEKGRKQYTIEFGKRKAYYPEIKMTDYYVTVLTTDGSNIDINIKNLQKKSKR